MAMSIVRFAREVGEARRCKTGHCVPCRTSLRG